MPLQDGLTIPEEIQRRQERKAKLARAKAEIEARAHARFVAEQAQYAEKLARRQALEAEGKKPRGREPEPPSSQPEGKDQVNFTDEQSRIMKTKDGFQQAYNAQAGVETHSRLIVGARVTQAPNDKEQLVPSLAALCEHVTPAYVLVDSGFTSEAAVTQVERETPSLTVLAALTRESHGRTVEQLEKREDPPQPASDALFAERMRHRTTTAAGRALYKLRQQTVEPVFGIIKEAMGFRRFSLRGHEKGLWSGIWSAWPTMSNACTASAALAEDATRGTANLIPSGTDLTCDLPPPSLFKLDLATFSPTSNASLTSSEFLGPHYSSCPPPIATHSTLLPAFQVRRAARGQTQIRRMG